MTEQSADKKNSGMYYKNITGQTVTGRLNDYATPTEAWDEIIKFIPKDKTIYEPFYLDGGSGKYLKSKGLKIIHEKIDFYDMANEISYDFILSNPPFQDCKRLFAFLDKLDKPFMLLLPTNKLHTNYISKFFKNRRTQIVVPRRRIHFLKYENGHPVPGWKKGTAFDCVWICYKMGFEKDITYSYGEE